MTVKSDTALRVVIAPDSFKGSATAAQVADAIAEGWRSERPNDEVRLAPMADGGEGTLDAFEAAVAGSMRMPVRVEGPDDREVEASWLWLPGSGGTGSVGTGRVGGVGSGGVGIVELACTSGITLLRPLRPFDAHTVGFGQAIAAALDHGVEQLVLAVGGSSSTDGGVGALVALGGRFLDVIGGQIPRGNRGLGALAEVDLEGVRALPPGGALILSDVTNPLLGARGAAAVFGPQKGADSAGVVELEANLGRLARLLPADATTPGAGAAGGTGFGLLAWGATLAAGASAVGEALGLPAAIATADVVITGEGRFDTQSAAGKVPDYVSRLAASSGAVALLVAGRIDAPTDAFAAAEELAAIAGTAAAAMADPLPALRAAGAALARRLAA
jgi:glycerate kinase